MARNILIRALRATRAALNAQAAASGLLEGEPYLMTDEGRVAMGTGTDQYAECVMEGDIGVTVCSQTDARLSDARAPTAHAHAEVYQPVDAELTALAGLASASDRVPYFTGNGTAALATLTPAARTLLDDANVATMASTLGLGTSSAPRFIAVEVGHASDTTLARLAAGDLSVEGNRLYRAGGTDVPITDGGTGASDAATARSNLGLGTAATTASTDYATAAQGALASSSVQPAQIREILTADREYYVRTDGNDSNDGLADSPSRSFATIQKAVDVVCGSIDAAAHQVYINIVDSGTHTVAEVRFYSVVGAKTPILRGSGSGMSQILSTSLGFVFEHGSKWIIEKCKFMGTNCLAAIRASYGGAYVGIRNVEFGAISTGGSHMFAINGSLIEILGSYTISGGAAIHFNSAQLSNIFNISAGYTITLVGTPAFSIAFCKAQTALIRIFNATFSGAATGPRYLVQAMGTINTNSAGESFFPGNAPGTAQTGGMYI